MKTRPFVRQLVEIIYLQHEQIQQLKDEIARLEGLKARPQIAPAALETPHKPPPEPGAKRPGSAKRSKTAQLTITQEIVVLLPDVPPEAVFKGYEDFVVQDLDLKPRIIRYRREHWLTPDGHSVVAPLPADVLPGSHFGPDLICYILHQYHHQHVTQPLLLEQLEQLGIDISAGEPQPHPHRGKGRLSPGEGRTPCRRPWRSQATFRWTTPRARHRGHNGSCTHIGNELFASFASTESKSRLNFLEILRRPHTDYQINNHTVTYWRRQKLSAELVYKLCQGPSEFVDSAAWRRWLWELEITKPRDIRIATEGALLGSLIAHGVSPELVILSDGAEQYDLWCTRPAGCTRNGPWARLIPSSEEHQAAIATVREQLWKLYQDLKGYRQQPEPSRRPDLQARFDAL